MTGEDAGVRAELQSRVTALLLGAVGDAGFVLAGAGAIRQHGLTDRPTEDVDLFTVPTTTAEQFGAALDAAPSAYTVYRILSRLRPRCLGRRQAMENAPFLPVSLVCRVSPESVFGLAGAAPANLRVRVSTSSSTLTNSLVERRFGRVARRGVRQSSLHRDMCLPQPAAISDLVLRSRHHLR